ncbi:MAG TPA: UDP-glucuronic acid decarboxylase family protein [Rhizomicrobium sp.]|jgi:UDP-glucuronate decarboxylase|nr:UDP-glucuronic acid decarboxylase family protein [Rhizomicrobium sp.]
MKRILIAGGAGFLGSHLCERLIRYGHEITALDNFHTGSRANIAHLLAHPRFHFVKACVTKLPAMAGAFEEIYNLACPASPPQYQRDPHYTVMINVLGVSNLIALAKKKQARLLQASTSEVYGDPLNEEQCETDLGNVNCTGPRACYDEGKRCAETLLFDAWRAGVLPIKVARIFNTYGPRMQENDGRIISNFVTQALAGQPMTIHGDGSQTRSFCYVDDLIEGLIRLMESPDEVTGPVNLGNPDELSVRAVADRIAALLGVGARITFKPLPKDDPRRRRPNILRAREFLGWQPSTPLDEGLARTIEYFRVRRVSIAAASDKKDRLAPVRPIIVSENAARPGAAV